MTSKNDIGEQAKFLSEAMEAMEKEAGTSKEDREFIRMGYYLISPLLKPPRICAGYEGGWWYVKLDPNTKIRTIEELQGHGYKLRFAAPPFGKPMMLKKR